MRGSVPRLAARLGLSALYGAAGVAHLVYPDSFLPIMPQIVPFPREIILITGVCEIAGAVALHVPRLTRLAGIMLALYALCVWPANIKHALLAVEVAGLPTGWWYHGPRLALQPVLIWLALWATGASSRKGLDRALEPFKREGKHAPAHQLANHSDGMSVVPAAGLDRVQPD